LHPSGRLCKPINLAKLISLNYETALSTADRKAIISLDLPLTIKHLRRNTSPALSLPDKKTAGQ